MLLSLITSRAADRVPTVRSRALGALTALAAASRDSLEMAGEGDALEMTIGGVHDQQVGVSDASQAEHQLTRGPRHLHVIGLALSHSSFSLAFEAHY